MKQQSFPLFEEWEKQENLLTRLLYTIDHDPPQTLLPILTEMGVTTPKEERRAWDEAYGYREEGGYYHWVPFDQFIDQQRSLYREIVTRVRDGKADNFQQVKNQIADEGRENLRTLMEQLRKSMRKNIDH